MATFHGVLFAAVYFHPDTLVRDILRLNIRMPVMPLNPAFG